MAETRTEAAGKVEATADTSPATSLLTSGRGTAWTLTVAGAVGLIAAFVLLVEKIALIQDPEYVPTCSINPVLSCGSVMNTDQAAAFGFPNPILGVAGFAVLLTIGVVLLTRVSLPRWFWWGIQAGTTFGVVFVHWLVFQSLYRIGALCPYCMVVWVAAITAFVATTARLVSTGQLPVPARLRGLTAYAPTLVVLWLAVIAGLIAVRFWDYWVTVI
ncbi:vitamin K epoxide reductase [Knoellia sinensis KCTC 19936]|uniref:Vitamin K epoxide reductase n=1 Tax=Knoellia sinensis KCTC 19936 TaxID=1385520 RepID=A0A0A0J4K1_9MICO|nr:vitamin K epoxide reductase family protein [Knoellia sinensis]KGN32133.1 vitamin K epoxide reductase [Knoellia sinensis KCTC 19936]